MKKRLLATLLCIVLVLLTAPPRPAAAEGTMNFIAIDELMPMELTNCVAVSGGTIYVPGFLFANYSLGISYSYFSSAASAYFYAGDKQLFFELDTGRTYDGDDNSYAGTAFAQNGTVYVPLYLIQGFFGGFDYSYLTGGEYGNILRITTAAAILSDMEFLRAARSTMRIYYDIYNRTSAAENYWPEETPTPAPAVTPAPGPAAPTQTEQPEATPAGTAAPAHAGERLTLGLAGMPTDRVLTELARSGIRTCFFLTAEDVRSDPDMVRRLVGEGHSAGVRCAGPDLRASLEETGKLLFEAARVRTVLIAAPEEEAEACRALAQSEGLVFCGVIRGAGEGEEETPAVFDAAALAESAGGQPLLPDCSALGTQNIVTLIRYLDAQQYDVAGPRETERRI